MRACVIFRGENLRYIHGVANALDCVDNWKKTIIDIIGCDIVFITYNSPILEQLIEKLKPVYVQTI